MPLARRRGRTREMPDTPTTAGFEIVRREDFSDVTYLLEVRHPADGQGRAARPVRHRHVASRGRAHSAHHRRFRSGRRHRHAGHPGRRQDHARDAAGLPGRHAPACAGRADGHADHDRRREEGGVRRRRPRRGADVSAGARVPREGAPTSSASSASAPPGWCSGRTSSAPSATRSSCAPTTARRA